MFLVTLNAIRIRCFAIEPLLASNIPRNFILSDSTEQKMLEADGCINKSPGKIHPHYFRAWYLLACGLSPHAGWCFEKKCYCLKLSLDGCFECLEHILTKNILRGNDSLFMENIHCKVMLINRYDEELFYYIEII